MNDRMTLERFLAEDERDASGESSGIGTLLLHLASAIKQIAALCTRGALRDAGTGNLDLLANQILVGACAWGGQLAGMVSGEMQTPHPIPLCHRRGEYLLVFDPPHGSSNLDVNIAVGTIFSILRRPEGDAPPGLEAFLQPGSRQLCAGYALHGPSTMLVLTLGRGVHGFTLDPGIGEFVLTHPGLRIPEETHEVAVNASNERFWEPPVRLYVEECILGRSGPRGADFDMRWIGSLVAEVHRILIRGGLFMYPRDTKDPSRPGRLRLLYQASPMAMIVEQAGGAASTGRIRLLDVVPRELHDGVAVILGSRREVERLVRYHADHDRGRGQPYTNPLFRVRSLFRSA